MGASPKTKADFQRAIEHEMNMLECYQQNVLSMKKSGSKQGALNWQMKVTESKNKIAKLKLQMKNAPKG